MTQRLRWYGTQANKGRQANERRSAGLTLAFRRPDRVRSLLAWACQAQPRAAVWPTETVKPAPARARPRRHPHLHAAVIQALAADLHRPQCRQLCQQGHAGRVQRAAGVDQDQRGQGAQRAQRRQPRDVLAVRQVQVGQRGAGRQVGQALQAGRAGSAGGQGGSSACHDLAVSIACGCTLCDHSVRAGAEATVT